MQAPLALFRCVAKAALNAVGFGVAGDFATEILPQMVKEVWASWGKDRSESERKADVQTVVQTPAEVVHQQVHAVVQEIAADHPPDLQAKLETYLQQIQTVARRTLNRPEDPRGVTLPPGLSLRKPEDLLPFLPERLPRFKPGDRPISNVDLELIRLQGVGGFGEVWLARNTYTHHEVALKFCLDPTARELLPHEATVLGRVMKQGSHPGIVPLRHTYLSAEPPCLEYEFIEGGDLTSAVHAHQAAQGPLSPGQASRILLHLARAVGPLHRLTPPIVHRDLKPANVLVRRRATGIEYLVTDFGIGGVVASQALEQTRQGATSQPYLTSLKGAHTPLYASPEQKRGEPPDPRDDVHALGVIWYQLLVGDFSAGAPVGAAWKRPLRERGMSDRLIELLESCIESQATYRPASAAVIVEQLEATLAEDEKRARQEAEKERVRKEQDERERLEQEKAEREKAERWRRWRELARRLLAVLTEEPQSVEALSEAAGVKNGARCLAWLADKGRAVCTAEGYYALPQAPAPDPEKAPPARAMTKVAVLKELADQTDLSKQQIEDFFNALQTLTARQLGRRGPGEITLPELVKLRTISRRATPGRPAHKSVSGRVLRVLKEWVRTDEGYSAEQPETTRGGKKSVFVNAVGGLWTKLSEKPEQGWEFLTSTPGSVPMDPDRIYSFGANQKAGSADFDRLVNLAALSRLTELDLCGCKNLADTDLESLRKLYSLEAVRLNSCTKLQGPGLAQLGGLPRLGWLELGWCKSLTDDGLVPLRGLKTVRYLSLAGCKQLTPTGFAHLAGMTALERLDLMDCTRLTDRSLATLRGLTGLRSLHLWDCNKITDVGLALLSSLRGLTYLSLTGCNQLTDDGLAMLAELTTLEALDLSGCEQITDAGLKHLHKLPNLVWVELDDCPGITEEGSAPLAERQQLLFLPNWEAECDHCGEVQVLRRGARTQSCIGCGRVFDTTGDRSVLCDHCGESNLLEEAEIEGYGTTATSHRCVHCGEEFPLELQSDDES